jgi:ketosteroid isomerase-like protein
MSQENVELYRRGIEAFNRRDLEAFLALAHPDVVGVSRVLAIEGGPYRGHDGIRVWWNTLLDVFPDFSIEILDVRDGGRVTVAALCNRARGEGRAALEDFVWQIAEWTDGKVVSWEIHGSERAALEAAGLAE